MKLLDESAVPYRIILTKTDEVKRSELEATLAACQARLKSHMAANPEILSTSSHGGAGLEELRSLIWQLTDESF
jgi:GTP-binding protein